MEGGAGFSEAYLFHRATRTLVLADLVQNLETGKLPAVTALLAELARSTCGRTPVHVRLAVLLGGRRARDQIEELVQLEPDIIIFAHGRWFATNAADRLRRSFGWLLGTG